MSFIHRFFLTLEGAAAVGVLGTSILLYRQSRTDRELILNPPVYTMTDQHSDGTTSQSIYKPNEKDKENKGDAIH